MALKGRSLPIYREVFEENNLKGRAPAFIERLSSCIPVGREVLIIMDAGFGDDWFDAITAQGWFWLVRARGKKFIKLTKSDAWVDVRELYHLGNSRAKHYPSAEITNHIKNECKSKRVFVM